LYLSLAILLARENVEGRLHAPETNIKHFWLCVWANCHHEKLHFLGNDSWTTECTWLPKMSTWSLAGMRPIRVIIGPAEYQDIAAQIITDPHPCFTVGTRQSVLQASLGVPQR
jgi:hypothetical protein